MLMSAIEFVTEKCNIKNINFLTSNLCVLTFHFVLFSILLCTFIVQNVCPNIFVSIYSCLLRCIALSMVNEVFVCL